jgi:NAD(P)H-hydrate epimerase
MPELIRVTKVPRLPPRDPESHKGTYGRVLVIAGSRGMTGAAILCGSAALRGGAGLVTVASPSGAQQVIAGGNPCYTTHGLADANGQLSGNSDLRSLASGADVVAAGPGLGRSEAVGEAISELVRLDKPLVLDADALNVLNSERQKLLAQRATPAVLTPHPGEFARLNTLPAADAVQGDREELAVRFARDRRVILLLKGHHTIVTDGTRVYVNQTGNPGMATGGCGDVLTGLISALIGQKLNGFAAAVLGAWVHGRAGDFAAGELGQTAMTAADLLQHLPTALREVGP